ncbi:hypothetical protein ACHAXS_002225 [Conticribra weissflogii]
MIFSHAKNMTWLILPFTFRPAPSAQAPSTPPASHANNAQVASPIKTEDIERASPITAPMPPPGKAPVPAVSFPKPAATNHSTTLLSRESTIYPASSVATFSTTASDGNTTEPQAPTPKTVISEWEDKKQLKRAANRLSAHLSRKRKKMFIEELKDENQELRRKEQILRSIPDLIVVFDSSGNMSFVSQSITRFLDFEPHELENSSFWDRLDHDSVRLIKAAFMDALAVKRTPDEDSTPLSNGDSISVRLIERDGNRDGGKLVSLKGVVHFAGDSPECVCSIRPEDRAKGANVSNNKVSKTSTSKTSLQARREQRAAAAGVPTHQISDVDSEKS